MTKEETDSRVSRKGDYFGVLEPYDGKLSRTVLRGERSRKAPDLPGGRPIVDGTGGPYMHAKRQLLFVQGGGKGTYEEWDNKLAESLRQELGQDYEIHYPRMPNEANPNVKSWKRKISDELSRLRGKVLLVGHSVGGSILLKYLSEEEVKKPIAGLFLLAAPSWDEDQWNFDDLKLPHNIADKLASIPRIFLYHSRDDVDVPFAHLALHGARLPHATIRAVDGRGHQFGNDLTDVARDIRSNDAA
jgi:predicted alpha/beta hydrolase family esterase